jgi:hypothetical protein
MTILVFDQTPSDPGAEDSDQGAVYPPDVRSG